MPIPTISACMIVKNEAETLERCLKSISPYVDEIIIVDTGSTDGTEEIAKQYTDKVYSHPWEESFAKARNHSLSYAAGAWIIYIDADEELAPEHGEWFRSSLPDVDSGVDHLLVRICNLDGRGGNLSEFTGVRIFRNGRGIHFEGIVHNQVVAGGEAGFAPVTLLHYGYSLDPDRMETKFRRTLSLTLKQIEDEPGNPYYYHNLCLSLTDHGNYSEALDIGENGLALMKKTFSHPFPPSYFNLIYLAGKAALACGNPHTAISICEEALDQARCPIDILWILTMAHYRMRNYAKAASYGNDYRSAMAGHPDLTPPGMPVNTLGQAAPLLATAGYSAAHLGRHDHAIDFFLNALERVGWDQNIVIKILEFCKVHQYTETGRILLDEMGKNSRDNPIPPHFINDCSPQQSGNTTQHKAVPKASSLIQDFESDPLVSPLLKTASLAEIRQQIERDPAPLSGRRSLLMVLDALEHQAQGDRSW